MKLNIDASWSSFSGSAAGILRDLSGMVADGFAEQIRALSPQHAEALALLQGLSFVSRSADSHVEQSFGQNKGWIVESDSSNTMEAVMGWAEPSWDTKDIIELCKEELHFLQSVRGVEVMVDKCLREANRAADWLANSHRSNNLPPNWVNYPPLYLMEILWNVGCSLVYRAFVKRLFLISWKNSNSRPLR